jgi:hypothetical protein
MYLAANGTLKIYNISNVNSPILRSSTDVSAATGSGRMIAVKNKLVYVIRTSVPFIQIWNVADPANPTVLGGTATGTIAANKEVVVSGNNAFATYQWAQTGKATSVDVADSTAPAALDTFDVGSSYAKGLAVSGNNLYVCWHEQGLKIFDVSNPAAITLTASFPRTSFDYYEFCDIDGNYLYVGTAVDAVKLRVFDVSNPATPLNAGTVALPVNGAGSNGLVCRKLGTHVITAQFSATDYTWCVVDVSDPINPAVEKSVVTTGAVSDVSPLLSSSKFYIFMGGNCILYQLE